MTSDKLWQWSGANWFLLVLPLLAAAAYLSARSVAWSAGGDGMEAVLLVDACLTIPLLYLLCYRRQLPWWQLALRMIGLASLGVYLLTWIIPPEAQQLLPHFSAARLVGLMVLIGFEIWMMVVVLRLVFRPGATADQLQASAGVPPWIAKLMPLEMRFWRAVYRFLRGR